MGYYQKTKLKRVLKIDGIYSFHSFEYVKNFAGIEEHHDFWEFVYVDYGSIKIMSDDDTYVLADGEAFLHRPNEWHNIYSQDEYASTIIISFGCDNANLEYLCKKILRIYGEEKQILENLFQAGLQGFEGPWDIFDQQKVKCSSDAPYGTLQITLDYLELLLLKMIQKEMDEVLSPVVRERRKEQNSDLDTILDIMAAHLYDKITLDSICRSSGCSRSHVSKLFKKTMNMGVMDYFNHLKIKEAKRMISEGQYTFTEIAEKLNYSSVHYFSRQFKKITNMTPSGYQKSVRNKMTI